MNTNSAPQPDPQPDPYAVPMDVLDTFITSAGEELGYNRIRLKPENRLSSLKNIMADLIANKKQRDYFRSELDTANSKLAALNPADTFPMNQQSMLKFLNVAYSILQMPPQSIALTHSEVCQHLNVILFNMRLRIEAYENSRLDDARKAQEEKERKDAVSVLMPEPLLPNITMPYTPETWAHSDPTQLRPTHPGPTQLGPTFSLAPACPLCKSPSKPTDPAQQSKRAWTCTKEACRYLFDVDVPQSAPAPAPAHGIVPVPTLKPLPGTYICLDPNCREANLHTVPLPDDATCTKCGQSLHGFDGTSGTISQGHKKPRYQVTFSDGPDIRRCTVSAWSEGDAVRAAIVYWKFDMAYVAKAHVTVASAP